MTERKKLFLTITLIVFIIASIIRVPIEAQAEDVNITLAIWPVEVQVGETVTATVTINGDSLASYSIQLEYPMTYLETSQGADGVVPISGEGPKTFTFTFKAKENGTAHIETSGYQMYNADGVQLSIMHAGGNVVIGEVQQDEGQIVIGGETYTFVNEYKLPKAPEGYVLSYVNYGEKSIYAYQAPNQNLKVVCLQNAEWEKKWFVFDEETQSFSPFVEYNLEGISYVVINKPDDLELPDGFTESNLTLKGSQIVAYTDGTDNGLFLVAALNPTGRLGLYFYDTDEGTFTRYEAVKAVIDAATASDAAKNPSDNNSSDALEASSGDALDETSTQSGDGEKKYADPLIVDDEDDEGFLTYELMKKLLVTFAILFVILCLVVIILIIRNGYLQEKLDSRYDDEDDPEDEEQSFEPQEDELVQRAKTDAKSDAEQASREQPDKNLSYTVNQDTGEILLEEAMDNNSGVNVPPAEDVDPSKIEQAMKERPFGVDSAFDVVSMDEAPEGDNVYVDPEPKQLLFGTEGMINPALYEADTYSEAPTEVLTSDMLTGDMQKQQSENKDNKKQKVVLPGQDEEDE